MLLFSCSSIPEGVVAVKSFDKSRYLGKWYEIARFDFRFERNLNNTTANYSLNDDGTIKVVNRGYNYLTGEWKQATGKAKFAGAPDVAMLKVSFFGPFYAGYNVIALDPNYRYALVCGNTPGYLWILSRETTIPDTIRQQYVEKARSLGFDVTKLLWIEHNKP
jgi:apolipoprotein D and lipocalin family protein